jgi:hypothetical protein
MKLLLLILLTISCAKAAQIPASPSKADVIAIKSAQLIEYKFKIQDPARKVVHWHYEMRIKELQSELSNIITYK